MAGTRRLMPVRMELFIPAQTTIKLQRESIRYKEVVELADVLGYDLIWQKRR